MLHTYTSTRHWQRLRRDDPQAPAAAAMAWNAARGSSKRAGRAPTPPALRRPRRGPRRPRAARPGRGRAAAAGSAASASARAGGRARGSPRARLGSDRVVASGMEAPSLSHTVCRTAALPLQAWRHRISQRFRYEADGRWCREWRRGRAPDAPRPIANCRPRASAGSAPSPTLESAEAWGRRRRASAHITRIIHHEHVRASTLPSLSHCTPSYYCMGSCMTSYS